MRPGEHKYQLRAWWDIDRNGCFAHPTDDYCSGNELFIDDLLTLASGIHKRRYNLGFNPKESGLYSRFRLTWDPLNLDVKPYGEYFSKAHCDPNDTENCVSHGEVEDYVSIPEPNFTLGFLSLVALGAGSALRSKQNSGAKNE